MDEYDKLKAQKAKLEIEKEKKYKEDSRERLKKICITKIRTTMIGALESIEKRIKQFAENNGKKTNEQLILEKLYDEMRNEILDRGNQQIRNLEAEFEQYEINWKRFTLQLPVKPLPINI